MFHINEKKNHPNLLGTAKDVKILMKEAVNTVHRGKNYAHYESELDLNLESCYRVLKRIL